MKIVKRVLAALFGAIVFCIIVPLVYHMVFNHFPFDGVKGIAVLAGIGLVTGAILGAIFPRVFGFLFENYFFYKE